MWRCRCTCTTSAPRYCFQRCAGRPKLTSLEAYSCTLDGSLGALSKLTALQSVSLQGCGLGRIPRALAVLPGLTCLVLSGSDDVSMSGSLRCVLPQLPQLQALSLAECGLEAVPEALLQLHALTCLDLSCNPLCDGWERLNSRFCVHLQIHACMPLRSLARPSCHLHHANLHARAQHLSSSAARGGNKTRGHLAGSLEERGQRARSSGAAGCVLEGQEAPTPAGCACPPFCCHLPPS